MYRRKPATTTDASEELRYIILDCWHSFAGTFANENGVYVGPDGAPVDRTGNPIGPPGTTIDDEGFIVGPDGQRFQPNGQMFPEEGSLPEGKLLYFMYLCLYSDERNCFRSVVLSFDSSFYHILYRYT